MWSVPVLLASRLVQPPPSSFSCSAYIKGEEDYLVSTFAPSYLKVGDRCCALHDAAPKGSHMQTCCHMRPMRQPPLPAELTLASYIFPTGTGQEPRHEP